MRAPAPVATVTSVRSETAPKVAAASVVAIVPANSVRAAAVLVRPPVNRSWSVAWSPSETVPVFANVTALVTDTGEPVSCTS